MAVAFTIMGLMLGLLGILCTYVWKGNHRMEKAIIESQKVLVEGQKMMMGALERIEEGQKEGFKTLSEMLLNQTKILEKIEGKIPAASAG
ncbi:MAG: hypothetical protein QME07_04115 [bacterium]|nr:hypothetical protein [bacterium]